MQSGFEIDKKIVPVRHARTLLSPIEFDNQMFLALTEKSRDLMNAAVEEIPFTEATFSSKTGVRTTFPKLDELCLVFCATGLATPEMMHCMLESLIRPKSPVRTKIVQFFKPSSPSTETPTESSNEQNLNQLDEGVVPK